MTPSRGAQLRRVLDVAVQADAADAANEDLAGVEVQPAAVAGLVHRLRIDDVEAQAVVHGQLRVGSPRVLRVVEVPPLPFACIRARADVAGEARDVAEQEGRQAEPAAVRTCACGCR